VAVWEAEVVVDPFLASDLIATQFPELQPVSARLIGAGWDNTAYLVNESIVFRFPRRSIAVPLIATEVQLLPWLSLQLPLKIPVPTFRGAPSEKYAWPFAGYRALAGQPLPAARLSSDARRALTVPLARFLAALHAVPSSEAADHGAPLDIFERLTVSPRRAVTTERLNGLAAAGVIRDSRSIEAILDTAPVLPPRSGALVHGDLHAGQIIVDDAGQMVAVIDWGDVHRGDPAVDLAAVHAMLPSDCHDTFLNAYGPVDPTSWSAARARAAWHSVALLASAMDTEDDDMADEAKTALMRLET
jgi:aminoglycoside phosphotransferase (APT) family kinase protein